MRRDPSADDLLAAYVDGVTELTPDERKRVEALVASDAEVRRDEAETCALLGQLRELPAHEGSEPDWSALERAIGDAVGPDAPRAWWRRWRFVVPGLALATTAAIVLILAQGPRPRATAPVQPAQRGAVAAVAPTDDPAPTLALWLDGHAIELDADIAPSEVLDEMLDDPLDELADDDDLVPVDELLAPSDLAWTWIDELDDEALERAEQWLARAPRDRG